MIIRNIANEDIRSVTQIYNYYVENHIATFEEQAVDNDDMASRIQKVKSDGLPWLVAEIDQQLVGYAYASKWKTRSAYRYSVEISVYLKHNHQRKGLGSCLYQALFKELEPTPIHAVIGGITLPNAASVALHEKFGMRKVAHFKEVGYKFGKTLDVGYWQLLLEPNND